MKTSPLQTLERQNADQGQLAMWSGRPYQMPNLNPVGGVAVVICLERGADCLHMVQLMPLPSIKPVISCHP